MRLEELLENIDVLITYVPVRAEVNFIDVLPTLTKKDTYTIEPDASLDPVEEAKRAMIVATNRKTAILVPGRHFDATGTRHGKGAGWYDRFLAVVPASWIRVGFCMSEQFSSEPLIRQSWDEPMDYLIVVPNDGSPSFYTTSARPDML